MSDNISSQNLSKVEVEEIKTLLAKRKLLIEKNNSDLKLVTKVKGDNEKTESKSLNIDNYEFSLNSN